MKVFEKADKSITRCDVEKILKKLKAEKTAELDGLSTDCLSLGGSLCGEWMIRTFNLCLNFRRVLIEREWHALYKC